MEIDAEKGANPTTTRTVEQTIVRTTSQPPAVSSSLPTPLTGGERGVNQLNGESGPGNSSLGAPALAAGGMVAVADHSNDGCGAVTGAGTSVTTATPPPFIAEATATGAVEATSVVKPSLPPLPPGAPPDDGVADRTIASSPCATDTATANSAHGTKSVPMADRLRETASGVAVAAVAMDGAGSDQVIVSVAPTVSTSIPAPLASANADDSREEAVVAGEPASQMSLPLPDGTPASSSSLPLSVPAHRDASPPPVDGEATPSHARDDEESSRLKSALPLPLVSSLSDSSCSSPAMGRALGDGPQAGGEAAVMAGEFGVNRAGGTTVDAADASLAGKLDVAGRRGGDSDGGEDKTGGGVRVSMNVDEEAVAKPGVDAAVKSEVRAGAREGVDAVKEEVTAATLEGRTASGAAVEDDNVDVSLLSNVFCAWIPSPPGPAPPYFRPFPVCRLGLLAVVPRGCAKVRPRFHLAELFFVVGSIFFCALRKPDLHSLRSTNHSSFRV